MPRFFYHTQTDKRLSDPSGTEYATLVDARRAAIKTCAELIHEAPEQFWGSRPWTVTVTDEAGLIMWEVIMHGVAGAASPID
jgi:hypothetical protein